MRRTRTTWAGAAGAALLCEVLLCCLAGCGTEEVPGSPSSDELWPTGDLVAVAAPAAGAVIVPREREGMPEGESVEVLLYDEEPTAEEETHPS